MPASTGVELPHRQAGVVAVGVGVIFDDVSKACDSILVFAGHLEAAGFVEDGLVGQFVFPCFSCRDFEVGCRTQPILTIVKLGSQTVGGESDPLAGSEALYDRRKPLLGSISVTGEKKSHTEFIAGVLD